MHAAPVDQQLLPANAARLAKWPGVQASQAVARAPPPAHDPLGVMSRPWLVQRIGPQRIAPQFSGWDQPTRLDARPPSSSPTAPSGRGGVFPALEHLLRGERRECPFGQRAVASLSGPIQRRGLGRVREDGPLDVGRDPLVEIMAHRDLPDLSSFFRKLKRPMVAVISQVLHPEPADGADPGAGVDERPEDRPVPKPVHTIRLDGGEELARLVDRHLGRAALTERMARTPDRLKGIQHGRVASHQHVEEMAQSGQGLVLGGGTTGELVQEPAG